MATKLLLLDSDGTVARVTNPFYAVAKELSCYRAIKGYTDEYLAGLISYDQLVFRQNPVFKEAGRRYAKSRGHEKLSRPLFLRLLSNLVGDRCVSPAMIKFLETVGSSGYRLAMISSGWDFLVAKAANEANITYWRANGVLFIDGEFAGTVVHVSGDKTRELDLAIRSFDIDYSGVFYLGDSEFDLIAMEFIKRRGGECLVRKLAGVKRPVHFPPYVRQFASLKDLGAYLRTRGTD